MTVERTQDYEGLMLPSWRTPSAARARLARINGRLWWVHLGIGSVAFIAALFEMANFNECCSPDVPFWHAVFGGTTLVCGAVLVAVGFFQWRASLAARRAEGGR